MENIMRLLSVVAAILIGILTLAACGGGGGSGGSANSVVSGVASKGIIRNGVIKVYALNADGSKGALLKETVTDNNGAYRADLGAYLGAILVEASGSYTDEATGAITTVPANAPLRAAINEPAGDVAVAVTPLTELAVQRNEDPITRRIAVPNIMSSNALIAELFKVDIVKTMPVDPLVANSVATQSQKEYALVLAAFARLMQSKATDLRSVITELKDSIGTDNRISTPVAAQFQSAITYFAGSSGNRTGIADISITPLINIGGSRRSLVISVTGTTTPIAGIQIEVILPPGVSLRTDASGKVQSDVLQASNSNAMLASNYTPPSASMRGRVNFAMITNIGFYPGEIATLQFDVAPNVVVSEGDFIFSMLKAVDLQGDSITGLRSNAQFVQ